MRLTMLFVWFFFNSFSQDIIIYGKNSPAIAFPDSLSIKSVTSFAGVTVSNVKSIFIFSTANSTLTIEDEDFILNFVFEGGGIYLGAENFPFNEECNQLSELFFQLKGYGNFSQDTLVLSIKNELAISDAENIESGRSTVSFPLDYRLNVIAWSNDNPIIISANYGKGKVILDGGYSRFYNKGNSEILSRIVRYLLE